MREGGHDVPPELIRRRYHRGISNFVRFYLPLAHRWRVYDNTATGLPHLVAQGGGGMPIMIRARATWERIVKEARGGDQATEQV